ncbi:rhomboid family intramembrane serine protease [Kineococcus radiotolerans]|uniref:Rhomboid family protein n=1 Tax=Kineococcus radiotolerans (strain ATCC BAA-149 / DSM 14245 / SRS30216) TaxID=266940 RepID=A6W3X6_KINRD|nr:rhomboid family intramembrane serine protease [Kineococcus radiotolerans]ABS01515.1 Rhomboid family protein [Kineococcus radiotolerans SRS30216 = ATCC BAA-149]
MSDVPVCPRHPDRESWVRCQRCERPTCPECQRPAAVGVQCVDCVAEGNRGVRAPRTSFGGVLRRGDTVVTKVLIGTCLVVFGAQQLAPDLVLRWLPLINDDARLYSNAFSAATWWQPLTSGFLHGGLLHLLFNTYALWVTGQYLEPLLGRLRFTALYVVSVLGGAVGGLLLPGTAGSTLVGASGGIFGLFAALFVVNRQLGRRTGQIAALIAINFFIGVFVAGISWQAHLGGMVTGALVATAMARGRRGRPALQWGWTAAVALAVLALLAYAALRWTL